VDGHAWKNTFDMVWNPVFSPDGGLVATKFEKNGKKGFVVNDQFLDFSCEDAWPPAFSPDGSNILLRSVENDIYFRRIIPVSELNIR
jgi:hypothetical protein